MLAWQGKIPGIWITIYKLDHGKMIPSVDCMLEMGPVLKLIRLENTGQTHLSVPYNEWPCYVGDFPHLPSPHLEDETVTLLFHNLPSPGLAAGYVQPKVVITPRTQIPGMCFRIMSNPFVYYITHFVIPKVQVQHPVFALSISLFMHIHWTYIFV